MQIQPTLPAWGVSFVFLFVTVGCAQSNKNEVDERFELKRTAQSFHRDLRWSEFEKAAQKVTESHRQEFLGHFEEYGDDLDIVNLELKTVKALDTDRRQLSVEQQWLVEPDMTVRDDTYIEVWTRSGKGWKLDDRMKKEEWERRQEAKETADASDDKATTSSTE